MSWKLGVVAIALTDTISNKACTPPQVENSPPKHEGLAPMSCGPDLDSLALAREAVKAGLLCQDVLDHLTSLHSQVHNSMKYRYLLMQLYNTINNDEQLFVRMVRVFIEHGWHPTNPANTTSEAADDFPLGTEHIPDLAEFLVPYAYQWRSIGTAMRFKPQDLNNIQARCSSCCDALKQCLLLLLEEWLGEKHQHALIPTVKALENILNSRLLGLGVLACRVRTCFAPKQSHTLDLQNSFVACLGVPQPYGEICMTQPRQFDGSFSYSKNTDRIEAEENGSVLLEIQVLSQETVAPMATYQWLVNDIPISESAVHTGTKSPILCISNADIDMDGCKYSCQVNVNLASDENIQRTTKEVTLRVNCPLDEYTSSLASIYSAQPEVPKDSWPPVSSTKHINLALIKQEQVNYGAEYARHTIRGDMDDVLEAKQRIEYAGVVKRLESKHVLFIEGRPGCGKTTFVNKITRDWATTTPIASGALRLVLLVSLRVLNNINKKNLDLSDLLNLFKDLKVSKTVLEERDGKGVCFIFDGLDEFSPCDGINSLVFEIIFKSYLSQSIVIVASRPAALAEFRSRADEVVEVLGFPNEQIDEYFDHYPFTKSSKSTELKAYFSVHPNVLHMCYLPIHSSMVAFLFEVTGKVPKTETEIYTHFTHFTLKRNFSNHSQAVDVHNLSGEEERLFNRICELALEKTLLNKQVLLQDEVRIHFQTDKDVSLGLITVDRTADLYGFKDIYTFLHLTFQEYLAARHISTLSEEEQHEFIQTHGDKIHMLAVWKFYCGLVKLDSKFKTILSKLPPADPRRTLYLTQCAYESQQSLPCTLLLKKRDYCFEFRDEILTASDFRAMGFVMDKSVLPIKLVIANCNINFNVAAMKNMLLKIGAKLRELDISDNSLDDGAKELASGLEPCSIVETLNLGRNSLSASSINSLLSRISASIRELDISDNGLGDANAKMLTSVLAKCSNLEKLNICKNGLSALSINVLLSVIGATVKDLNISDNSLGDASAMMLAPALGSCKNLERISICNNGITKDGVRAIFSGIKRCSLKVSSQDVIPGNINITCGQVAKILHVCTNLQSLTIGEVGCESPVYENVSSMALSPRQPLGPPPVICRTWRTLKELKLFWSGTERASTKLLTCSIRDHLDDVQKLTCMDDQAVTILAAAISKWQNFQVLDLSSTTNPGSTGLCAIASSLVNCASLKELHLNSCGLDSQGANAISPCLKHCRNLQVLSLLENCITVAGAKAIAENLHCCALLEKLDLRQNWFTLAEGRAIFSESDLGALQVLY